MNFTTTNDAQRMQFLTDMFASSAEHPAHKALAVGGILSNIRERLSEIGQAIVAKAQALGVQLDWTKVGPILVQALFMLMSGQSPAAVLAWALAQLFHTPAPVPA